MKLVTSCYNLNKLTVGCYNLHIFVNNRKKINKSWHEKIYRFIPPLQTII